MGLGATGAAILGAGALGAGASILGSQTAAGAQEKSTQQATQTEQNMFNTASGYQQPYIQQGQAADTTLNQLLGVNGGPGGAGNSATMESTLENLPGYQFTLNQGLKSTQNGYAARGLADSGGALKGASTYSTGLAQTDYGNYVNQLLGSAQLGENAAGSLTGAATQTGSNIGSNQIGAGNAAAAASNATGNAIGSAASNVGSYYTLQSLIANNGLGPSANSTIYSGIAPPGGGYGSDVPDVG